MGVMDRFLNAMRLNSDEDDYYDDDFYDEEDDDVDDEDEEEEDYEPRRRNPFRGRRGRDDYYDDEDDDDDEDYTPVRSGSTSARSTSSSQGGFSKVTQMRPSRRSTGGSSSSMEVCVIKPISVDDSREITETLLSNRTVILNLEGMDIDIAQRIIDFTSGSCYAIGGSLQKVSNYIFVVTPSNVDISGDIQDIMSAFGSPAGIQTDI